MPLPSIPRLLREPLKSPLGAGAWRTPMRAIGAGRIHAFACRCTLCRAGRRSLRVRDRERASALFGIAVAGFAIAAVPGRWLAALLLQL